MLLREVDFGMPLNYNRNQVKKIMDTKGISKYEAERSGRK